jgi:hypothetical protein
MAKVMTLPSSLIQSKFTENSTSVHAAAIVPSQPNDNLQVTDGNDVVTLGKNALAGACVMQGKRILINLLATAAIASSVLVGTVVATPSFYHDSSKATTITVATATTSDATGTDFYHDS